MEEFFRIIDILYKITVFQMTQQVVHKTRWMVSDN